MGGTRPLRTRSTDRLVKEDLPRLLREEEQARRRGQIDVALARRGQGQRVQDEILRRIFGNAENRPA